MTGEHTRRDGWLQAWQRLNQIAKADLDAKRGEIQPPRTKFAYYDSTIVQIVKHWRVKKFA